MVCQCGCGQEIPSKPYHKYVVPKYIYGHHLKNSRAALKRAQDTRRPPRLLCACGCGQLATLLGRKQRKYVRGHSSKLMPKGPAHPKFTGKHTYPNGYIEIWVAGRGFVKEHRYIWEQANGPLAPNQHVHHINGNPSDNRLENLIAMTRSEHSCLHHPESIAKDMTREQRQAAGRKGAEMRWRGVIKPE